MEDNTVYLVYQKDIEDITHLIDMLSNAIGCVLEKKEIPTPPWDEEPPYEAEQFALECEQTIEKALEEHEVPW